MAAIGSMQIIPYYAHPHVHTVINDDSYYDETVATAEQDLGDLPFSTVIVTGADQGIDNKFVRLSDRETKVRVFGKSNFKKSTVLQMFGSCVSCRIMQRMRI